MTQYLSDAAVRSLLGCSRSTLRRYRRKGFIKAVKLDRKVLYPVADLEAALASLDTKTNPLQGK